MKRIVLIATCIVLAALLIASCGKAERPLTVEDLLDLGKKFLLDMDYEQALVQFLHVIDIEPMNPRGYTGAAEAYMGLGDRERAKAILEQGRSVIGDNAEIQRLLDELQPPEITATPEQTETLITGPDIEPAIAPTEEPIAEMRQFLRDLLEQYASGGYESIYAAVETVEYQTLITQVSSYPVIYIDDTGSSGIGLYLNAGYIYVGGYAGEQRSGNGIWIRVEAIPDKQYRFEGEWADDLPNGSGVEYTSNSLVDSTKSGFLINGLWDGYVILKDSNMVDDFYLTLVFSNGKPVVIGEPEEKVDLGPGLWYPTGYIKDYDSHYCYSQADTLDMLQGIGGCFENP